MTTMLYPTVAKMEWLSIRGSIERKDIGNVRLHVNDSKGACIATREFPSVAEAFAAFPDIAWDAYMDAYKHPYHREDAP